jgi:hypothetical protein
MIGVTSKIGEFFASLIWALFGAASKLAFAAILIVGLLIALLFAVQFLISRHDGRK